MAITLLILGSLVANKRLKRKKRLFHAPPTNQLPSWRLNSSSSSPKGLYLISQIRTNAIDKSNRPKTNLEGKKSSIQCINYWSALLIKILKGN